MMLTSMAPTSDHEKQSWQNKLQASPTAEMHALFAGLDGHFIPPGKGNDPIRSPDSLPTGRNFYALDNSLIPSKVAWEIGQKMASEARLSNPYDPNKREAQILWASDVVRDEGVMVAFALDMMGLKPKWNSRGLVNGLEVQALEAGRHRRDMVFTTSGLFRDLYALQMEMLDRAVLISLAQSAKQIELHYPTLIPALDAALAPLGKRRSDSNEPLQNNQIAAHWVEDTQALLAQGIAAKEAAHRSSLRLFGDAPGSYGAGINRLVERSGAWQQREELADVYLRRLGHAYSSQGFGEASQDTFKHLLTSVQNTYFGRSSNLYGLIDNNDAFDYLGGLSLTVETLSGQTPNNFVLNHSDPHNIVTQPLKTALRQELRGRFLNPEWLKGLMNHGYAGARTMGSEFLEYLWGWQVTNPTLVGDWAWEEVKDVYLDDRYQLGLDEFLQQGQNVHVKANMLAIMLVAINKGFWQTTDETTRDIASQFADLVAQNGLPGSGHTTPDHPMMPWLEQYLTPTQWQDLKAELDKARPTEEKAQEQHSITEITLTQEQSDSPSDTKQRSEEVQQVEEKRAPQIMWVLLVFALLFIVLSAWRRNHNLINTMRGTK
jgi:cobaltochelatase CobN